MGNPVKVYIYDLTNGMAKTLGPALIGRPLDGVWHTAVVVYGREYYFGSAGIESCEPGGTLLGNPLQVEELGETEIPIEVFNDYLRTHSQERFKGERYDLFRHNCNNFSHETAQFLTGSGIPQHILDLPNEILSTPMGQMLAPMIQQMTPTGNSIPFTLGDAIERTGLPNGTSNQNGASSESTNHNGDPGSVRFPVTAPVLLDNPLNVEGIMKKLMEFNKLQTEEEHRLNENDIKMFQGIATGLVRISKPNFVVIQKVLNWSEDKRFPALDLLRQKCLRFPDVADLELKEVVELLVQNLETDGDINAMLAAAALANVLAKHHYSSVELETVLEKMTGRLPATHRKLELHISSFLHNLSIHITKSDSLEDRILVLSSVLTTVSPVVEQVESHEMILITLGNILHSGHQEVRDLAHAMEIQAFLDKVCPDKHGYLLAQIKQMLNNTTTVNGIDLE